MKVSVIIPAFNREAYIETAIRSLLRQRADAELDIVVVDDGSDDRTAERVAGIAEREPVVRLVRQGRGGISRARNTGLRNIAPDADLVTFLDSDDVSVEGRFAADLPHFRDDPALQVTYGLMLFAREVDDASMTVPPEALSCVVRGIHLSPALIRKDVVEALGGFNEDLAQSEDWDFLLRLFEPRPKYLLTDTVAMIYRKHEGNVTRDKKIVSHYFMKALLMSVHRRKRDPSRKMPDFFDFESLRDPRYDPLR